MLLLLLLLLVFSPWAGLAETRVQSGDWYGSGTQHPGQVIRGSLPLLSPYYYYLFIHFVEQNVIDACLGAFFDLCSSPNIIWVLKSRRIWWVGHVGYMKGRRVAFRVLVGKHERKRPLGRPGRRWEDNIKVAFLRQNYPVVLVNR